MKQMLAVIGAAILTMTPGATLAASDGTAVVAQAAALMPNRFVWSDDSSTKPVNIVVSIADQKAYVFRGETMIAASTVSTGKDGKDTPVGTFPILQKAEKHKSNLYDSAPMPFMQRLTWDGVAIHAGANPGFPASHGCIRVPTAFAKRLFAVTAVGTQVVVTDEPVGEGWTPPAPYDATAMALETKVANGTQLDALPQ